MSRIASSSIDGSAASFFVRRLGHQIDAKADAAVIAGAVGGERKLSVRRAAIVDDHKLTGLVDIFRRRQRRHERAGHGDDARYAPDRQRLSHRFSPAAPTRLAAMRLVVARALRVLPDNLIRRAARRVYRSLIE